MNGAYVTVTTEGGRPAEALAQLLAQRAKWLNETAEQACTATMLDILISLRALTAVAKPNKKEIVIENSPLALSFTRQSGAKARPCLRHGRARYALKSNERMMIIAGDLKNSKVFTWKDTTHNRVWYIIANNQSQALNWAFEKVKKRAMRFKGLARIALSKLMMMSGSKTSQQMDNGKAANKASQLTKVTKSGNGSTYALEASDLLDYAKLALKGGESAVNTAMMKAANKITSVINVKCKNLLMFSKLDTPFPDVKKK